MTVRPTLFALCLVLASCGSADPPPQEPPPIEYSVVRGDTLFLIAKAHGVTVDQLRVWNGIEGDLIEVGQVLRIHPGEPDASPAAKPRPRAPATRASGTSEPTGLRMPDEKPCLDPPTLAAGADHAMAASQGLSEAQVREAMNAFVHHTVQCLEGADTAPREVLDLEIRVACTGRVSEVQIRDPGDWPEPTARCVREVLRHTPFPAHDLPDGDSFLYPLSITPG